LEKKKVSRKALPLHRINKRDNARDGLAKFEEESPFTQPCWMNQNTPPEGHAGQSENFN